MKHFMHTYKSSVGRLAYINRQAGLTLIELMISIAMGLVVVSAAIALLLSSKVSFTTQDDGTRLQDTGRYAMETISRALRQVGYENWDRQSSPMVTTANMTPNIMGFDSATFSAQSDGISKPLTAGVVNNSDALAVRFFGVGAAPDGDGSMINCAGFPVAEPQNQTAAETERGWSIFYVTKTQSEPELICKYKSKPNADGTVNWTSSPLVSGVESFQVLYGVDTDPTRDYLPNQYLTATEINALDATINPPSDKNRLSYWKRVMTVKVSILARSAQNSRAGSTSTTFELFGPDYPGTNDKGTKLKTTDFAATEQNRLRKVFSSTMQIRNDSAGSGK